MKISLKPAKGEALVFSVLPEQIQARGAASYQSFDIITKGTIKVPKGTDVTEISWDGEFFGKAKKKESLVQTKYWISPNRCVKRLTRWMEHGTELTLIVSGTWINMDVTVSSFSAVPYGAFGNVKYSLELCKVRDLKIYTAKESGIGKKKQTKARSKKKADTSGGKSSSYTVKKGDTLIKIAKKKGCKWQSLYSKNKVVIEKTARKRGLKNSDRGHWIFPGTKLAIP